MMPFPLLLLLLLGACSEAPPPAPHHSVAVDRAMGDGADAGFARALAPRAFHFPADHGPHPAFKHEWWYVTGNLADDRGRRFGYQVTLFRIGLAADGPARESAWAARRIWMAHVALSDIEGGGHLARERFSREAIGLAGARTQPLAIWVEDWRMEREDGSWRIRVDAGPFALRLELSELGPPVLQGDAGLSRKSAEPGNASYYYSIPRLATRGRIRVNGEVHAVQGLSWLDREWSTSALGPDQVGWDWFSLQLADGGDLMYYRLRRRDGSADPHSRGSLRAADGERLDLRPPSLALQPLDWWQAPQGGRYPVAWSLHILPLDRRLTVRALLPDQWMDLAVRYWEGAVAVFDGEEEVGYGYLEMTGY